MSKCKCKLYLLLKVHKEKNIWIEVLEERVELIYRKMTNMK